MVEGCKLQVESFEVAQPATFNIRFLISAARRGFSSTHGRDWSFG